MSDCALSVVSGYRSVASNGPLAGRSVFHLYVNLLGAHPLG
jgi:hypothetical protein